MKFKITYFFLLSILVWILNTSDKTGKSTFVDCSGCHGGSSSTSTVDSITLTEVSSGNRVSKYTPGVAYTIKFYGSNTASLSKFGFQVNPSKGTISSPATNSKITTTFWQHSTPISGTSGKYIINAVWTAPAAGSGNITFQSWLNAVNGDNSTSGDAVSSLFSVTYSEQTTTVKDTAKVTIVSSASNPVKAGTSVTFTATAINGGSNPLFQWKLNGVNIGTSSSQNTYTTTTLKNNDEVSCVLTSNLSGVVGSPASSNVLKMSVVGTASVQVSQNEKDEINLLETSISRIFKFSSSVNQKTEIEIFNLAGKRIISESLSPNQLIDLSTLNSGIIIVNFKINNELISKKIVIE